MLFYGDVRKLHMQFKIAELHRILLEKRLAFIKYTNCIDTLVI
jgi:hypothetical protein